MTILTPDRPAGYGHIMARSEPPPPEAARLREQADELAAHLRDALATAVYERRVSHRELARRTGRAPDYWTKVFGGHRELHASHIFQALLAIDLKPEDLFARIYPREGSRQAIREADAFRGLAALGRVQREGRLEPLLALLERLVQPAAGLPTEPPPQRARRPRSAAESSRD